MEHLGVGKRVSANSCWCRNTTMLASAEKKVGVERRRHASADHRLKLENTITVASFSIAGIRFKGLRPTAGQGPNQRGGGRGGGYGGCGCGGSCGGGGGGCGGCGDGGGWGCGYGGGLWPGLGPGRCLVVGNQSWNEQACFGAGARHVYMTICVARLLVECNHATAFVWTSSRRCL